MRTHQRQIVESLENFDYKLFGSNVLGIGYGLKEVDGRLTEELCIKFYVKAKLRKEYLSPSEIIPATLNLSYIEGQIATDVCEGEFFFTSCSDYVYSNANTTNKPPNRGKFRPIKGGMSAVNASDDGSACTLGWVGRDQYDGNAVGITNLHCVMFASRTDQDMQGTKDSTVIANHVTNPSPWDGGNLGEDTIGYVKRIVPWSTTSKIYADVAIYALKQSVVGEGSDEFVGLNFSAPFLFASTEEIDEALSKGYILHSSGRTTGPKSGSSTPIKVIEYVASALVSDGQQRYEFGDLMKYAAVDSGGNMCPGVVEGGDSGSCLLASINGEIKIIGLVFAGISTRTYGLACRIDRIRDEACVGQFGVKIDNNWIRTDIRDGTQANPKTGYTAFSYIIESDLDIAKNPTDQKTKTAVSLRDTNQYGARKEKEYFLLGEVDDSQGNFLTPKKKNNITGNFTLENESVISKYVVCGESISGSANEDNWNPSPPASPPNTNPPSGGAPITGQDISGVMTVNLSINTNEIQHVDFNNVVGKTLSNWHVVDQSGASNCDFPPIHGTFGPGYGHTWQGWILPQAHPQGNCGSDGTKINGFESNGKGHFWPQLQLVNDYDQDTHAVVKAYDSSAGRSYAYSLFYSAKR
jgi:hypothetical protein